MAERRTRRSFTREFKAQAVKRLLDSGKGLSEVATELGIGMDFPPWSGGVKSERHAAARMVIPSMLARASAGVR